MQIVEILFARGLVKVLFATETFAMVRRQYNTIILSGGADNALLLLLRESICLLEVWFSLD